MIEAITTSGSRYIFADGSDGSARVMRLSGKPMRGDDTWLTIAGGLPEIVVGQQMHFTLEPLAEGADATLRWTSPVETVAWLPETANRNFSG